MGEDFQGRKHVLALREGAIENAEAAIIDGSRLCARRLTRNSAPTLRYNGVETTSVTCSGDFRASSQAQTASRGCRVLLEGLEECPGARYFTIA